ncbi:MAG TPA: chemotaxis protein CheX [Actinotalea sp.]|jgi:hypothetical protein
MKLDLDYAVFAGTDPIYEIADEVFTAMIDGEQGLLSLWEGEVPPFARQMHAWVDVHGAISGRVLLSTEQATAEHLTRALLGMTPDEPVADGDIVDALGEVANVVGGNVKALVPDPGALSLPQVTHERPPTDPESLLYELALCWRGQLLVITLWSLA